MKLGVVRLAALVALAAVFVPAVAGAAAPTPEQRRAAIEAEVRRLKDQVHDIAHQEAQVAAELHVSRRERAALDAKVAQLEGAIAVAQVEQQRIDDELAQAIVDAQVASAAVEDAERDLRTARSTLRRQAVDAYIGFGTAPSESHLFANLEDVNDAPRVAAYVDAIARRQAEVVRRLRRVEAETAELEADALEAKALVFERQLDASRRRAALEAARAEQAAARAEVAAEQANEQRLLTQVQAQRREHEQRLAQLQRESNDIAAQLRRRQAGQAVTPSGRGVLSWPVMRPVVTSTYGYRVHPIFGDRRLHAGIDLSAQTGTPVYSARDGVVVFAGWKGGYGNTVIVDHGGQIATLYAHNNALSVATGASVRRGQQVAQAGSTGNSTGPHVHFEVRVGGSPVDPMGYL